MRVQIEETADDSKRLRSSERVARDLNRQVALRTSQLAAANEERKRSESLLNAEKRTLEMIANGASLSEVLNDLCDAIDAHKSFRTSRSEEHTSELQSRLHLVCRLLL